jgi:hypothetical protein
MQLWRPQWHSGMHFGEGKLTHFPAVVQGHPYFDSHCDTCYVLWALLACFFIVAL